MAKVTFSDENIAGDIPTIELSKETILLDGYFDLENLLENRNGKIIVCFQTWKNCNYEHEHQDFLISNDDITTIHFYEKHIENIKDEDIHLNFFCFDTYEDAFKYCIDLKEGL